MSLNPVGGTLPEGTGKPVAGFLFSLDILEKSTKQGQADEV